MMTDKIIVYTTCDSEAAAVQLARDLVDKRLAACVNILSGVRSIYRWKDKTEDTSEWMLVIKTSRERFADLSAQIQKLHTYEVPEVIAIPIVDGSEAYLDWLHRELILPDDLPADVPS